MVWTEVQHNSVMYAGLLLSWKKLQNSAFAFRGPWEVLKWCVDPEIVPGVVYAVEWVI